MVVLLLIIKALQCPLFENKETCAQCCGAGMFIPDPEFYPSRISDPEFSNSTKRGGEKMFVLPFFVATNIIY